MWAANAATCTPSIDTIDAHVHFTPANLVSKFHRSLESSFTHELLKEIFATSSCFRHHNPLPPSSDFADEGAANHTRLCRDYHHPGIHLFVYGRFAWKQNVLTPKKFPARQTFEASQAITRNHVIFPDRIVLAQQNPLAIDAGVFHNDVASVGNKNVFLYHEEAFVDTPLVINRLAEKMEQIANSSLIAIQVESQKISMSDAVKAYLFNSQIVSINKDHMALIAPNECNQIPSVREFIENLISDPSNPIREVHYLNVRESMRNGGGPACLRLRVPLTTQEIEASHAEVFLSDKLYDKLKAWIQKHYRDRLTPTDLADPSLWEEIKFALDDLTNILNLGPIYSFQRL
jgi:succinylarginine dihydrolase